jgi:hypothetical protein
MRDFRAATRLKNLLSRAAFRVRPFAKFTIGSTQTDNQFEPVCAKCAGIGLDDIE